MRAAWQLLSATSSGLVFSVEPGQCIEVAQLDLFCPNLMGDIYRFSKKCSFDITIVRQNSAVIKERRIKGVPVGTKHAEHIIDIDRNQ